MTGLEAQATGGRPVTAPGKESRWVLAPDRREDFISLEREGQARVGVEGSRQGNVL